MSADTSRPATPEDLKASERSGDCDKSVLADVPVALPALTRAQKLQKRAARVGFDWDHPDRVIDKIKEEIAEVEAEKDGAARGEMTSITEEIGDLLFACANLARKWDVDPETALRRGNEKFERRFRFVEARAEVSEGVSATPRSQLEDFWREAKEAGL